MWLAGWLLRPHRSILSRTMYTTFLIYIYITFMCSFSSKYNNKKKETKKDETREVRWVLRIRTERESVYGTTTTTFFKGISWYTKQATTQHNEFMRSKCRKMKGVVWRMDKRDFYSYCSAPYHPYTHVYTKDMRSHTHTFFFIYMYIVDISLSSCGNEFLCCFLSYFEYMSVRAKRRFSFKKKCVCNFLFFYD